MNMHNPGWTCKMLEVKNSDCFRSVYENCWEKTTTMLPVLLSWIIDATSY